MPELPDLSRLMTTASFERAGVSRKEVSRRRARGTLTSIRHGVLRVPGDEPDDPIEAARVRYLDRIVALAMSRRRESVICGPSAAAVWHLPRFGPWPEEVHLLVPPGSPVRGGYGASFHRVASRPEDVVEWGEFAVTGTARTVVDLARRGDIMNAVLALDRCLNIAAPFEIRTTKQDCLDVLRRSGISWGAQRVRQAVSLADGRADNGGESASRVLIHELGFETPQLQVRHVIQGRSYFGDAEWPDPKGGPGLIGEFDGRRKYFSPRYGARRTPEEILEAEKEREDVLRNAGFRFVRWGYAELRNPECLRRKLVDAGLRSTRSSRL